MAVFAPFIKPDVAGRFTNWHRRTAFGEALPSGRCSGFVHLDGNAFSESLLLAAFDGKLSVREPSGFLQPVAEAAQNAGGVLPTVTLYLEPTAVKAHDEWKELFAGITNRFSRIAGVTQAADATCFIVYRDVDANMAKNLLSPRLTSRSAQSRDTNWSLFVSGQGSLMVQAGDEIGAAAPSSGASGACRCSIGLRTRYGMFDLGTWYQEMLNAPGVQAPSSATELVSLLGRASPLIPRNTSLTTAGTSRLWPWSALLEYRFANNLKYSDWRKLGSLQKSKYISQLMARVRPASGSGATPFIFDVDDILNVFQLEAVTEFYLNLPEPWNLAMQPVASGSSEYRTLNLLSLYGSDARVTGTTLTLDDQLDMSRIMSGRDTIKLDAELDRDGKTFRIMAVDAANRKVTVDSAPRFGGSTGSAWQIFHNPTLIEIDAFGSRVTGSSATLAGANKISLNNLDQNQVAELHRVNIYDTISLSDVVAGTPAQARILEKPETTSTGGIRATVKVDRSVNPASGGSEWGIPSGIGGAQGWLDKSKYPRNPKWWDNYDGMMFLVGSGEVRSFFPWTSFSSQKKSMSSIKGNLPYRFASYFSRRNTYINAGFRVTSADGLLWGNQETVVSLDNTGATIKIDSDLDSTLLAKGQTVYFVSPGPPRFRSAAIKRVDPTNDKLLQFDKKNSMAIPSDPSPFWILVYDGTRDNRYYFKTDFKSRTVPAGQVPHIDRHNNVVPGGAMGIRIHLGENGQGSGSEGCQVSPYYRQLREATIGYHIEANTTYYRENANNLDVDQLQSMHTTKSPPDWIAHYLEIYREVEQLTSDVSRLVSGPLSIALDEVRRAGSDEDRLAALRQAIFNAQLSAQVTKSTATEMADSPSEDQVLPDLEVLLSLSSEEDTASLIQWAKDNADTIARLRQRIAELEVQKEQTVQRWGWDDAIHGEYFLVRPDEREK